MAEADQLRSGMISEEPIVLSSSAVQEVLEKEKRLESQQKSKEGEGAGRAPPPPPPPPHPLTGHDEVVDRVHGSAKYSPQSQGAAAAKMADDGREGDIATTDWELLTHSQMGLSQLVLPGDGGVTTGNSMLGDSLMDMSTMSSDLGDSLLAPGRVPLPLSSEVSFMERASEVLDMTSAQDMMPRGGPMIGASRGADDRIERRLLALAGDDGDAPFVTTWQRAGYGGATGAAIAAVGATSIGGRFSPPPSSDMALRARDVIQKERKDGDGDRDLLEDGVIRVGEEGQQAGETTTGGVYAEGLGESFGEEAWKVPLSRTGLGGGYQMGLSGSLIGVGGGGLPMGGSNLGGTRHGEAIGGLIRDVPTYSNPLQYFQQDSAMMPLMSSLTSAVQPHAMIGGIGTVSAEHMGRRHMSPSPPSSGLIAQTTGGGMMGMSKSLTVGQTQLQATEGKVVPSQGEIAEVEGGNGGEIEEGGVRQSSPSPSGKDEEEEGKVSGYGGTGGGGSIGGGSAFSRSLSAGGKDDAVTCGEQEGGVEHNARDRESEVKKKSAEEEASGAGELAGALSGRWWRWSWYELWCNRQLLLRRCQATIRGQAGTLWSLGVVAAILGVMLVGHQWYWERWQYQQIRHQVSKKEEMIDDMKAQVSRWKDGFVARNKIPVIRASISSTHYTTGLH